MSLDPTSNLRVNRLGGNRSTGPVINETFGQPGFAFSLLETLEPFEVLNRHDHRDRLAFPMNCYRPLLSGIEQLTEVILRFCGGKGLHDSILAIKTKMSN